MRVGIDLDGVLYPFMETFCELAGLEPPDPCPWDFFRPLGMSEPEFWEKVRHLTLTEGLYARDVQFPPDAHQALRELRDRGHRLEIVTARLHHDRALNDAIITQTFAWLRNSGARHLFFGVNIINRLAPKDGVDILVDDAPHNLGADAPYTPIAWDRQWNGHVEAEYRARTWEEVVEHVVTIEKCCWSA